MLSLSLALVVSSISHAPDPDPAATPDPEEPSGPRSFLGLNDADPTAARRVGSMTVSVADSILRDAGLAVGDSVTVTLTSPNKPRAEPPPGL